MASKRSVHHDDEDTAAETPALPPVDLGHKHHNQHLTLLEPTYSPQGKGASERASIAKMGSPDPYKIAYSQQMARSIRLLGLSTLTPRPTTTTTATTTPTTNAFTTLTQTNSGGSPYPYPDNHPTFFGQLFLSLFTWAQVITTYSWNRILAPFLWYFALPALIIWLLYHILIFFSPDTEIFLGEHVITRRCKALLAQLPEDVSTLSLRLRYNFLLDGIYRFFGRVWGFLTSYWWIVFIVLWIGKTATDRVTERWEAAAREGLPVPAYMARPRNEEGSNYLGE